MFEACNLWPIKADRKRKWPKRMQACPASKFGFSSNPIASVSHTIDGKTNYGATACVAASFHSIPEPHDKP